VLIAALLAAAPMPAVFGLQLDEPISLPACRPHMITPTLPSPDMYDENQPQTCQAPAKDSPYWYYPQGSVFFPVEKMPAIMSHTEMTTFVIDGKLEGMSFATLSPDVGDEIIRQLGEKFGKPTFVGEDMPNRRARFTPARQARWEIAGLRVEYHNMGENPAYGWVRIETDKARLMREHKQGSEEQQRTPL
jgi:hypothetical protein